MSVKRLREGVGGDDLSLSDLHAADGCVGNSEDGFDGFCVGNREAICCRADEAPDIDAAAHDPSIEGSFQRTVGQGCLRFADLRLGCRYGSGGTIELGPGRVELWLGCALRRVESGGAIKGQLCLHMLGLVGGKLGFCLRKLVLVILLADDGEHRSLCYPIALIDVAHASGGAFHLAYAIDVAAGLKCEIDLRIWNDAGGVTGGVSDVDVLNYSRVDGERGFAGSCVLPASDSAQS